MARLTKRTVEALPTREGDYIVFDDDVSGFGVRVLPSGKKTYMVQYRNGGRTRRIAIGKHGAVTADQARTRAKELLGAVAGGDNPAEEISRHRQAPTVATVCDRFLRDYVAHRCKPTTQREYRRSVDLFIKPAIGPFKIVDVARADIAKLHHKLRDKPYQANRTLGVLSKMFNLAEVWGLRPDGSNPCRHVEKYKERKRECCLSLEEIANLVRVLDKAEQEGTETPFVVAAFKLLILTGCRLSEIQTLKWSYVQPPYMMLPESKTGARKIPLPEPAQTVLSDLPRDPENEYVIQGAIEGQHVTDLQKPWRRIRKSAGLDGIRIHDLRHTYASHGVMQGLSIPMMGKLLGHTQIQTTMRYAHFADDPVREAAAQVAGILDRSFAPPAKPTPAANVVPFPKRA
ncbi:tyrosine-type recombinase/integrase [Pelagibius sp. CAU 1746]|uniref:tyrosine-type recombinase/integrase n=1 Tax=Pelagibius sp. CAU 1746 TaxID=3140370 RepID=UPI00325A8CC3